ncbi:MAG: hypothetical protein V7608_2151 [Hyphomicrobiales bacterium]|jgi:hypothetical protein
MSTPGYYRDEALHCRELAAKSRDADAIKRWLQMALEYDRLADSMAAQVARGTSQQQQIPQQQSKAEPDKNQA